MRCAILLASLYIGMATSGCAVQIKDQAWYGDHGDGAFEFHTLTDFKRDVPKDEWNQLRFGMVCSDAQSLADNKANIQKLCKMNPGTCNYDMRQAIEKFFSDLELLQEKLR